MEKEEAINNLRLLVGKPLHQLAKIHQVEIYNKLGNVNKGWAGHTIERYLGLPINSAQSPNFGSWELKTISLKIKKNGIIGIKETMAITMIDPVNVEQTPFERSHLLSKIRKMVIVARTVGSNVDEPSYIHNVTSVDLDDEHYEIIRTDYENIRRVIQELGFDSLSGKMGVLIQPRTKGPGNGSTSRAFYARTSFLRKFIDLNIIGTEFER